MVTSERYLSNVFIRQQTRVSKSTESFKGEIASDILFSEGIYIHQVWKYIYVHLLWSSTVLIYIYVCVCLLWSSTVLTCAVHVQHTWIHTFSKALKKKWRSQANPSYYSWKCCEGKGRGDSTGRVPCNISDQWNHCKSLGMWKLSPVRFPLLADTEGFPSWATWT